MSNQETITKECSVCERTLPLSDFYTRKRASGERVSRAQCKICSIKSVAMWGKKNPEKKNAKDKKYAKKHRGKVDLAIAKWRKANPEKMQLYKHNGYKTHLMQKFGITIEDYDSMYIEQGGCCGICGTHQSELNKKLCVDHCHETDVVRGLLCCRCNTSIGKFEDNVNLLQNAINYLCEATK